jgi:hypothetical protein
MSKHDDNYRKAIDTLADGLVAALVDVAKLDAEHDRYPDVEMSPREEIAFKEDRQRILGTIRTADMVASNALRAYQREAVAEARRLRAAAEAGRDPSVRTADELEYRRLVDSRTPAEEFHRQALQALADGQPRRADVLLTVAEAKGAKLVTPTFMAVQRALDESEPKRAEARELEQSITANSVAFAEARSRLLTKYGVGLGADGLAGTGAPGQAAVSSISAKLAAQARSQASGEAYVAPDGALASAPEGGDVRSIQ